MAKKISGYIKLQVPAGAKGKYVQKVSLTSTMGPGLKIDTAEVEGA